MHRRPYGPTAWLADDIAEPARWAAALGAMAVPGVEEIIPAETTVVVRCARSHHEVVGNMMDLVVPGTGEARQVPPLTIDVVYNGADIDELAHLAQMSVEDVVRLHSTGMYEVAFCGFSPGFGYLRGIDARLHVPRRPTPRTSVPAGSIGVAAGYTCVYPSASPGGWHLIGHTTASIWDASRTPPALLTPGRSVRFRRVPS